MKAFINYLIILTLLFCTFQSGATTDLYIRGNWKQTRDYSAEYPSVIVKAEPTGVFRNDFPPDPAWQESPFIKKIAALLWKSNGDLRLSSEAEYKAESELPFTGADHMRAFDKAARALVMAELFRGGVLSIEDYDPPDSMMFDDDLGYRSAYQGLYELTPTMVILRMHIGSLNQSIKDECIMELGYEKNCLIKKVFELLDTSIPPSARASVPPSYISYYEPDTFESARNRFRLFKSKIRTGLAKGLYTKTWLETQTVANSNSDNSGNNISQDKLVRGQSRTRICLAAWLGTLATTQYCIGGPTTPVLCAYAACLGTEAITYQQQRKGFSAAALKFVNDYLILKGQGSQSPQLMQPEKTMSFSQLLSGSSEYKDTRKKEGLRLRHTVINKSATVDGEPHPLSYYPVGVGLIETKKTK